MRGLALQWDSNSSLIPGLLNDAQMEQLRACFRLGMLCWVLG